MTRKNIRPCLDLTFDLTTLCPLRQCNALILALPLSIESFPIQFGVAWTASLASYFLPRQEYELNVEFSHSDKMVYNQAM